VSGVVGKRKEFVLDYLCGEWTMSQLYLCLDACQVGDPVSKIARKHNYLLCVKSRAEERLINYRHADSKTVPLGRRTNSLLAQLLA
jgi:hypothetical protein